MKSLKQGLRLSAAAMTLAGLGMGLGLASPVAAHPHDDVASHQAEHGFTEIAGIEIEGGAADNDIDVIAQPPQPMQPPQVQTQDFDIEDFLDANGKVNLEKLRAYEAGEPWRHIGSESVSETAISGDATAPLEVMIIPQDQIIFVPEGADMPPEIMGQPSGDLDVEVYDFSYTGDADMPPPSPPLVTKKSSESTIQKMTGKDDEVHSWTSDDGKQVRIRKMKKRRKGVSGERSISLSGETTIKIDRDGGVTIINNGQSVIPLSMEASESGSASAMVMDGGEPAKIKVNKTVEIENGKRKTRVIIDMEGGGE